MKTGASVAIFVMCMGLCAAVGCSRGTYSTFPMDMSAITSPHEFVIGVNRFECASEAVVGDTLHLRFWGLVGSDGCHEFSHFSTKRDSHQVDITVLGVARPLGICPEVIVMLGGRELDIYPLYEGDMVVVVHGPGESALMDTVRVSRVSSWGARAN